MLPRLYGKSVINSTNPELLESRAEAHRLLQPTKGYRVQLICSWCSANLDHWHFDFGGAF